MHCSMLPAMRAFVARDEAAGHPAIRANDATRNGYRTDGDRTQQPAYEERRSMAGRLGCTVGLGLPSNNRHPRRSSFERRRFVKYYRKRKAPLLVGKASKSKSKNGRPKGKQVSKHRWCSKGRRSSRRHCWAVQQRTAVHCTKADGCAVSFAAKKKR